MKMKAKITLEQTVSSAETAMKDALAQLSLAYTTLMRIQQTELAADISNDVFVPVRDAQKALTKLKGKNKQLAGE